MKTLKTVNITANFVEFMPETYESNVLYITEKYGGIGHLCLCGCGHKVWLPIQKGEWTLHKNENGTISLTPSILQRFECRSHYIITNNKANFV